MELTGARVLVAGATGVLGGLAARALAERGARVALAGRNPVRLAALARDLGGCPARSFEACDLDQCSALGPWATRVLAGLDGVLVTVGTAGFGAVEDVSNEVAGHLLTVNALCPMAILRGASSLVSDKGFLLAVTGAVADRPRAGAAVEHAAPGLRTARAPAPALGTGTGTGTDRTTPSRARTTPSTDRADSMMGRDNARTDIASYLAGTADYTASKAALSSWLGVLAAELAPRAVTVLDIRAPRLETGATGRRAPGRPPALPNEAAALDAARALLDRITSA